MQLLPSQEAVPDMECTDMCSVRQMKTKVDKNNISFIAGQKRKEKETTHNYRP